MKRVIVWLFVIALVAAVSFGATTAGQYYALLPGVAGCRLVADDDRRTDCVGGRAGNRARDDGAVPAIDQVDAAAAKYPEIEIVCHSAMHRTARSLLASGDLQAHDVEVAYKRVRDVNGNCAAGFTHGLLESLVARAGTGDLRSAVAICDRAVAELGANEIKAVHCHHGIGHGLRRSDSLQSAVTACEKLMPDGSPQRAACYNGVFMEDVWKRLDSLRRTGDLLAPCPRFDPGIVSQSCYEQVGTKATALDLPTRDRARACASVLRWADRDACFRGVGVSLRSTSIDECQRMGTVAAHRACLAGVLGLVVGEDDLTLDEAGEQCGDMPERFVPGCADVIGGLIRNGLGAADRCDGALQDSGPAAVERCKRAATRLPRRHSS